MPDLNSLLLAGLAGLAGFGAGWLHFASLEWVANRIVEGRLSAIALQLGRIVLLVGILFLLAKGGALVLLSGAAGILLGRVIVLRGTR
ncbi:ATP synthase subunit I [Hyphomonas sp.]|uniref:N-ATPase subunit AtpR n=1 Tax=Hyphomonas sp. TaxID=87 RepID=UPI0035280091